VPKRSKRRRESRFCRDITNVDLSTRSSHRLCCMSGRRTYPKARNVTPAVLSAIPSLSATVAKFGQKKSDAVIPIVANKKAPLRMPKRQIMVNHHSSQPMYTRRRRCTSSPEDKAGKDERLGMRFRSIVQIPVVDPEHPSFGLFNIANRLCVTS
jgi:hypothetical protein